MIDVTKNIRKDFRKFNLSRGMGSSYLDSIEKTRDVMPPYILEERQLNVAAYDIFSRLMLDRIIYFGEDVNDESCNIAISQLLYLSSIDESPIMLYINSPGGTVVDGLGLIDTMDYVKCQIGTICVGMAASMGAVILSNGAKGKRFVLPHSRVMIHQPSAHARGTLADMEISLKNSQTMREDLYQILAKNMGKTVEEITSLCDRDMWYKGQQAVDAGIVDKVLSNT